MRAVIYVRQSQDRNGDEAGVIRQEEDCRALADRRGWTVSEVIRDNDVSASTRKPRPGFEKLLSLVSSKRVDMIVVWHADRLTRKLADLERVIELCEGAGVGLSTVTGDLDLSTDSGRLVARILASVARGEIERKSARQARAQLQAAREGRRSGGRRPFGYSEDGMTVREDEAEAIRRAYSDLLVGVPLAEIARQWVAAGLHSGQKSYRADRRGQDTQWTWDTVRKVLVNPRNAALRAYKGEVLAPAVWPALVPEDTWRAAVDVLTDPSRRRAPTRPRFLLSGLGVCGICGATVHGGAARRHYRTYRCSGSLGHISRQAEPVEEYVSEIVVERLQSPDAVELLWDREKPDVDALRQQAIVLRARLDALAIDFAEGDLTASQLRVATERLRLNLEATEAEMAHDLREDILGPLVRAEDVQAVWERLSDSKKRAVIGTLMEVRLHTVGRGTRSFRPQTVEIVWKS